jgi:hypothetical protein
MSNISRTNMTVSVSLGVQTPNTREQWTHANLKLVELCHNRPYAKGKPRYVFEELMEKNIDPDIAILLDDIDSLLQEHVSDDFPWQTTVIANSRKTKRSGWFYPVLDSILESPVQVDTGTDPMPPPTVSDKMIQVDTEELKLMTRTGMKTTSNPELSDTRFVARVHRRPLTDTTSTQSTLNRDPWVLVGLGSLLRRRPVLAVVDGVHEDALRRLATMERITTNPFNDINRHNVVITVNEFPTTRLGPRRFRTRMIRTGHVINVGGVVLTQNQINDHARHNTRHHSTGDATNALNREEDPFQQVAMSVASSRMFNHALLPVPYHAAPFWQRLGIRVPVPRVWTTFDRLDTPIRRSMFPMDVQSTGARVRNRHERS